MEGIDKTIIQKLATEYNLPLKTVSEIINSQFKLVGEVMEKGKFESVMLPKFGKFHVKAGRVEHLNRLKKAKDERLNINVGDE